MVSRTLGHRGVCPLYGGSRCGDVTRCVRVHIHLVLWLSSPAWGLQRVTRCWGMGLSAMGVCGACTGQKGQTKEKRASKGRKNGPKEGAKQGENNKRLPRARLRVWSPGGLSIDSSPSAPPIAHTDVCDEAHGMYFHVFTLSHLLIQPPICLHGRAWRPLHQLHEWLLDGVLAAAAQHRVLQDVWDAVAVVHLPRERRSNGRTVLKSVPGAAVADLLHGVQLREACRMGSGGSQLLRKRHARGLKVMLLMLQRVRLLRLQGRGLWRRNGGGGPISDRRGGDRVMKQC
eukprot:36170-Chlamydomonas_euryale.AAC.1